MRGQHRRPAVLVIAATDSSGGAGLVRDVRVLTDFSADALCVVTAVTAQSDKRVTAIHHVPPEVIRAQIVGALETRQVGAIKLGMLGTRATVEAVAESLTEALSAATGRAGNALTPATVGSRANHVTPGTTDGPASKVTPAATGGPVSTVIPAMAGSPVSKVAPVMAASASAVMPASRASIPIVLDPVLVSSSGGVLLDAAGRAALLEKVLPLATLVTPNVPEVAALLGEPVAADEAELIEQGRRLLEFGCRAILLKGGHAAGEEAVDLLIARDAFGAGRRDQHGERHTSAGQGGWSDAGQNDAERGDAGQSDAGQDNAARGAAGQSDARQDNAPRSGAGQSDAGQSGAGRNDAGQDGPGPSGAGQSEEGRSAGSLDREELGGGRETGARQTWRLDDGTDYTVVVERITSKRVAGSSRGTGCALASGIAAGLASGLSLLEACRQAKQYVLEKMLTPGPTES